MPAGVEVVVKEGFATIDFVDGTLRGPGLAKLLEVGTPPEAIEKLTREGPRAVYVVPEGNAREAGLLDEVNADDSNDGPPPAGMTDARRCRSLNRFRPTPKVQPSATPPRSRFLQVISRRRLGQRAILSWTGSGRSSMPTPRQRGWTPRSCPTRKQCSRPSLSTLQRR